MTMIRPALPAEFDAVRSFYYDLIDMMRHAQYKPGWEKGIYPSDEYLRHSIDLEELWRCECDGHIAAAMIVNHDCNEGYHSIHWPVAAAGNQVTVIHALGVMPAFQGKGLAGKMVEKTIEIAKEKAQRAIRLDVLGGNLPAERLYMKHGFKYVDTIRMFYEDTGWTDFKLFEYLVCDKL